MIDPRHGRLSISAAVPLGVDRPLVVLLRGPRREPAESAPDAADRRAVSGDAVLRLAPDDALAASPGLHGGPQAGATPDATAGPAGGLPAPQDVSAAPGAQDLSLPAARSGDHAAEPRLVCGRDLHSAAARLSLPGRDHGLVEPQGAVLALVEHAWMRASASRPWKRPSSATERPRSSTPTRAANSRAWNSPSVLKDAGVRISMDGKGRWMDNVFIERLWRSLKYECVYLVGVCHRLPSPGRDRLVDELLQRAPTALVARRPDARGGVH